MDVVPVASPHELAVTDPRLEPRWQRVLDGALGPQARTALVTFLAREHEAGHVVHPPAQQLFEAFRRTPFDAVRVVILGQDPYHGPGQAMGLGFSVPRGVTIPPSLRNIQTEVERDLGVPRPGHGDLSDWADQGVLLLNASLTVRADEAGSHAAAGWQDLTDAAISALSDHREHLVFLLWGRHAQAKAASIDAERHLVLTAAHPSPLSASRGFHGCGHFSRANAYLEAHGTPPIDWAIGP